MAKDVIMEERFSRRDGTQKYTRIVRMVEIKKRPALYEVQVIDPRFVADGNEEILGYQETNTRGRACLLYSGMTTALECEGYDHDDD